MAKAEQKPAQPELRDLKAVLLVGALAHSGRTLKPFPKDAAPGEVAAAIATLRRQGLVHGTARAPNLTEAGIIQARKLAGKS